LETHRALNPAVPPNKTNQFLVVFGGTPPVFKSLPHASPSAFIFVMVFVPTRLQHIALFAFDMI
jgi:hypothetical protein